MSISNVSTNMGVTSDYGKKSVKASNNTQEKTSTESTESTKEAVESGAVYEKSTVGENKATYSINKMSAKDRAALVEQLQKDQENRKMQLADLVQQMLSKQGEVSNLADFFTPEKLAKVSPEEIEQAKKDVSEDGYWGIKQTSQRLFDFASALAGDDVEKMKEMQEAMQKGYEKAAAAWGKDLPEICQKTLDAANKLFDDYYASKGIA